MIKSMQPEISICLLQFFESIKAQIKKEIPQAPKCEPKKARAFGKGVEASGNKVRYAS